MLQRKLQHLAFTVAVSAIATAGLTLAGTKPVLAEFEIQEAGIEKGEVELEYRGAYHWGVPEVDERTRKCHALVQSHDFEMQMGITDWWLISTTRGSTVRCRVNWQVEVPSSSRREFAADQTRWQRHRAVLRHRLWLGHQQPKHLETAGNEVEFGPDHGVRSGKVPADHATRSSAVRWASSPTDGLGFEYGWRGEYDFAKHWGLGVEMFGEIEDLSNPGSFNDQNHSIGPTLFWKPGGGDEDEEAGDVGEGDDDNAKGNAPEPPSTEFSMNVGVQFGLTDVTSDSGAEIPRLRSRSRAWCASA